MSDVRQMGEPEPGDPSPPAADPTGAAPASGITSAAHLACALHEVSNALTVVLGWLDVAESAEPEDVKRAIAVAREHARRGQMMARRSIGAETESTHIEQTAAELAEFAVISVKPQAASRGVCVRSDCAPGADLVVIAPEKVLQILTNLLMNGLSFSPSGGQLAVSVERSGPSLVFTVEDDGPGVEAERRPSLFSSPTSTRPGGVGLGLPHSRFLAREAGGDLTLKDTRHGARFELTWPLAVAPSLLPSIAPAGGGCLAHARVLVVEDDPAIAALVDLSFSARGAEVIVVANAEEFVRVLTARPLLDLVLLDLSPVDDALSEALDSLELAAPVAPVILMSGQPSGIPAEAEGRFAAWVRKPFDMEELIATASGLLVPTSPQLTTGETSS